MVFPYRSRLMPRSTDNGWRETSAVFSLQGVVSLPSLAGIPLAAGVSGDTASALPWTKQEGAAEPACLPHQCLWGSFRNGLLVQSSI